jgi:formylmethanofuran dehydrogenase subunit B
MQMATDSSSPLFPSIQAVGGSHISTAVIPRPANELAVIQDAICTACGCMCDDIVLTVERNRIALAERACDLGKRELLRRSVSPAWLTHRAHCFIEGQPASLEDGYQLAAELLTAARYPLVYGVRHSTCEAQSRAVSIADLIGGVVDTTSSVDGHAATTIAVQSVGISTSTLGEVRNRSDFVLYWGSNPAESSPRHTSRYALDPVGLFVPHGRRDRTCIAVDIRATATTAVADRFIQVKPNGDFEALWILRALAKRLDLDAAQALDRTGVPLSVWQDLLERMKACRYGAIFFGRGISATRGERANSEAILRLTRELNAFTRFVARPIGGEGNVVGAENVLTWRTGYPFGVNLARGYPRYNPGEYTAGEILSRGEADAALLLGCDPLSDFPRAARQHLQSIPTIVLDANDTPTKKAARVAFTLETFGIHTQGTVYRLDDVPLALRPALSTEHPSQWEVLSQIEQRVRAKLATIASS